MGIEKNFPKSSNEVFDKIFSFLQKWRLLLKEGDARYFDERIKMLKAWLGAFWESTKDLEVESLLCLFRVSSCLVFF